MAEYARYYGGLPAAAQPWPLVWALIARVSRFEARVQLSLLSSVANGIGSAFKDDGHSRVLRETLFRRAYPVRIVEPELVPNLLHPSNMVAADA